MTKTLVQTRPLKKVKPTEASQTQPTLTNLPDNIFNLICSKLSLATLAKLSQVNKDMYYNRLNDDYFAQKVRENGIRSIVQNLARKQCEVCGVNETKTYDADAGSDADKEMKVRIKRHDIAKTYLCQACRDTPEYNMIARSDARENI